jgi:hypothetical protein
MEEAIKVYNEKIEEEVKEENVIQDSEKEQEQTEISQENTPVVIETEVSQKPVMIDLFEEAIEKNENYQSGFWNGYFGLSKGNYEGYLAEKARFNALTDDLTHHQEELQEVEYKIVENRKHYNGLFTELTNIHHTLDNQINLKQRRDADLQETNSQIDSSKKEIESLRNNNSFLGGVLFLVAAFVFIVGDLVISHEIVAYALNIKNNIEAWSFAVGLAMVSVLLKPAYDRLIEYPYTQDNTLKSKRIYLVFKILVVVFTIVTLCILGYFRYEAYRTDQLKSNINNNIVSLQEEENSQTLKMVDALTKKSEDLSQSLVNSSSGMLAFVLSGVMFAVAGAICLGIAFPILVAYIRIWFQIPMKLKKLYKSRQKQLDIIEIIEKEISLQMAVEEAQKNKLDSLGEYESLQQKKRSLQQAILVCKKELHKIDVEVKIYEVSMGHEKGELALKKEETKKIEEIKALEDAQALAEKERIAQEEAEMKTLEEQKKAKKFSKPEKQTESAETTEESIKNIDNEVIVENSETENTTEEESEIAENLEEIPTQKVSTISSKVKNKIKKK